VAPSLPNFGFSDGVKKRGFGIPQYAETLHKLMLNLGYSKYGKGNVNPHHPPSQTHTNAASIVTQGGDWGFVITRLMGILYPSACLASHVNFVRTRKPPEFLKSPLLYLQHKITPYTDFEKAFQERTRWFETEGFGYNVEQSTRPSTIGIALTDPVALLAWVYEKLHDWTDNYPWTDDEILTWISIYHFSTAGAAASVRIYYESKHAELERGAKAFEYVPKVQLGLSYFPKDLVLPPRTWGRALGPVVFEGVHGDGGHFAAHERPEALVDDLRKMYEGGAKHIAKQFI
jgi:pimeloyl-ACP methyl ester carboxylesterase